MIQKLVRQKKKDERSHRWHHGCPWPRSKVFLVSKTKFWPRRLLICLTSSPTAARQTNGFLHGARSFLVESLELSVH